MELEPKPKEQWNVADKKEEAETHRAEWCACDGGRNSKKMKLPGKCGGPLVDGNGCQLQVEKIWKRALESAQHGKKSGPECSGFGVRSVPSVTEADEPLYVRKERHEITLENLEK